MKVCKCHLCSLLFSLAILTVPVLKIISVYAISKSKHSALVALPVVHLHFQLPDEHPTRTLNTSSPHIQLYAFLSLFMALSPSPNPTTRGAPGLQPLLHLLVSAGASFCPIVWAPPRGFSGLSHSFHLTLSWVHTLPGDCLLAPPVGWQLMQAPLLISPPNLATLPAFHQSD